MELFKSLVEKTLDDAGIALNGGRPHDIAVANDGFYRRVALYGSLGLGESYMDGWWDCEHLDEMVCRLFASGALKGHFTDAISALQAKFFNRQNRKASRAVAELHYNLDTELYRNMLGKTMAYTCAYWKEGANLDDAQLDKYELICRKIDLRESDHVLDLGCGFGGLAKHMAERYGCRVTGVNISRQQVDFAREFCRGLPVDFHLCDYRDTAAYNPGGRQFDRIVSIGLCEHVGPKNYREWMRIVHDQLKDRGLFLLHTIGINTTKQHCDPWYDRYIFPNGTLPSIGQLGKAFEGLFVMEDWQNFGFDYHVTLHEWWKNFDAYWKNAIEAPPGAATADRLRFYRMWKFYLLAGRGTFRARHIQLWQIVLSRGSVPMTYYPAR